MKDESKKRLNHRALVALAAALAGAALPVTGIANHVLRDDPLTLARHAWMAAHGSAGALFIVFAVWHAALNRRALARHFLGVAGMVRAVSREFRWALALVGIPVGLAILHAFVAG